MLANKVYRHFYGTRKCVCIILKRYETSYVYKPVLLSKLSVKECRIVENPAPPVLVGEMLQKLREAEGDLSSFALACVGLLLFVLCVINGLLCIGFIFWLL